MNPLLYSILIIIVIISDQNEVCAAKRCITVQRQWSMVAWRSFRNIADMLTIICVIQQEIEKKASKI